VAGFAAAWGNLDMGWLRRSGLRHDMSFLSLRALAFRLAQQDDTYGTDRSKEDQQHIQGVRRAA
jgi:hypothetical protein